MLYTQPVKEDMAFLPSPEDLKKKIIVKAKKKASADKTNESESKEEEEAENVGVNIKANDHQVGC
jgi:hypothetical protein